MGSQGTVFDKNGKIKGLGLSLRRRVLVTLKVTLRTQLPPSGLLEDGDHLPSLLIRAITTIDYRDVRHYSSALQAGY